MPVYRALVRLFFPAEFRRRFGDDMASVFEDRRRAARTRGIGALLLLWSRTLADLARHGWAERRAARRRKTGRRPAMLQSLAQDVRYALRSFRRRPGFAAAALITLTLGIGANTAIFSVVYAVMVRSLPYPDADRIALVFETNRRYDFDHGTVNPFAYTYVETRNHSFATLSVMYSGGTTLTGAGEPARLLYLDATPSFFDVMAVRPELGRAFTAAEARDDAAVVVISHRLWTTRFGRRPDILDRSVMLDSRPWTIVGVMPASFAYPADVDVYRPLALTATERADQRSWYLGVIGRLKPGVTLGDAQRELAGLGTELEAAYPERRRDRGFNVVGLHEELAARSADGLTLLQGVVLFVLVIACVNVANLLLAQASVRRRELGIRAAVGGSRGRLVRQLLTESLVLALGGAAGGTLLALWGVGALVAMAPTRLLPSPQSIGVSWFVLAATAVAATVTGVVFGLVPALVATSPRLADSLHDGERTVAGGLAWSRRQWLRVGLVAGEIALALVLLTGAGLLVRSFERLLGQPTGIRADHVLTASISLPPARYPSAPAKYRLWSDLLDRVGRLPGVTSAAGSTALPFSLWEWQTDFVIKGREDMPNNGAGLRMITPPLFRTLGIPIVAGRAFTDQDTATSMPVVIVSDAFVRQYMSGLNPVGAQVSLDRKNPKFATVIGVVGATRHLGLNEPLRPDIYRPLSQNPDVATFQIALRTVGPPSALADGLRRSVGDVDPDLPIEALEPMQSLVDAHVAEQRFYMTLLGLFAALAVALAATGVYGVMACLVGEGRREIGIRLALGARPAQVRAAILGRGLAVVCLGVVAGLVSARLLSGLLTKNLFQIEPTDPITYLVAAVVVVVIGIEACWMPTRTAARIDPIEVLRS